MLALPFVELEDGAEDSDSLKEDPDEKFPHRGSPILTSRGVGWEDDASNEEMAVPAAKGCALTDLLLLVSMKASPKYICKIPVDTVSGNS